MTLENDVAARLERLARTRRQSMKSLVNETLRAGLAQIDRPAGPRAPFRTTGLDLGVSRVGSLDDVAGVLARVEGETHR